MSKLSSQKVYHVRFHKIARHDFFLILPREREGGEGVKGYEYSKKMFNLHCLGKVLYCLYGIIVLRIVEYANTDVWQTLLGRVRMSINRLLR